MIFVNIFQTQFVKNSNAGRHKRSDTIYIKHNLFQQSKLGIDVELRNTQLVLFMAVRDVLTNQNKKSKKISDLN